VSEFRKRPLSLVAGLAAVAALSVPRYASAHTEGFEIRSTTAGGGALVATTELGSVLLSLTFCAGGECLLENAETSVVAPAEDLPTVPLFALAEDTTVRMELVSADPGTSVRIAGSTLNEVGESVAIGKAHTMHAHPTWQVQTDEGTTGQWSIAFRFTTTSPAYSASDTVDLVLTNGTSTTSTTLVTSTTATTSTTLLSTECGNGVIEGEEICDAGSEPWSEGRACTGACEWLACGDPDGDGKPRASDALFLLGAAVGVRACDVCVCNVDASAGGAPVTGGDALRLLRTAVGLADAPLVCPPCE
jgi:hypothetical protein